ncbi:terminase small subunit [Psychrobacter pygoscelis]|uniref:terminase small subunit n=1 Tax=Psychrobacter pygoscelis TaxID=2488563 RepID=UPI00103A066A|nr:terminase small subunit [Psychrobacter pygoscelis]
MSQSKKLTAKQALFVLEYIKDFNGGRAARDAGFSAKTADQQAWKLLQMPHIQQAIDGAIAERKERLRIDADNVLWQWWQIATADYNELSSVKRVACGWCWGGALTDEDETAVVNPNEAPDPDCPKCKGEGAPYVHIADTTKLSPAAKLVYQGAKATKFGIEVTTADRMKALDNVARHLGMFKDKVEHTGADGAELFPSITVKYE